MQLDVKVYFPFKACHIIILGYLNFCVAMGLKSYDNVCESDHRQNDDVDRAIGRSRKGLASIICFELQSRWTLENSVQPFTATIETKSFAKLSNCTIYATHVCSTFYAPPGTILPLLSKWLQHCALVWTVVTTETPCVAIGSQMVVHHCSTPFCCRVRSRYRTNRKKDGRTDG